MKVGVYSMHDHLNGYGNVLLDTNDSTAIRNFIYAMKTNDMLLQNCGDYDLVKFGEFDNETAEFTLETIPKIVIAGNEVKYMVKGHNEDEV